MRSRTMDEPEWRCNLLLSNLSIRRAVYELTFALGALFLAWIALDYQPAIGWVVPSLICIGAGTSIYRTNRAAERISLSVDSSETD